VRLVQRHTISPTHWVDVYQIPSNNGRGYKFEVWEDNNNEEHYHGSSNVLRHANDLALSVANNYDDITTEV
jgi:hypothetical protein